MKISFKMLKSTGKYDFIKDEQSVNTHVDVDQTVDNPSDDILQIIFAPNPRTGYPSSDLSLLVSKRVAPEVRDYIQSRLAQPINLPAGAPDDQSAFATLKSQNLSGAALDDYYNDIAKFAQKAQEDLEVAKRTSVESKIE